MNYFRSEIKIGVLVFTSFVFLMIFVLSIGSYKLFKDMKEYVVYFDFVSGLEVNSPVRYSGVEVGHVKDIEIIGNGEKVPVDYKRVKVTLKVLAKVGLPKGTDAALSTLGLMGEKYIDLFPGKNVDLTEEVIEDGDIIIGSDFIKFRDMLKVSKKIVDKLEHIVSSVDSIIGDSETKTNLINTINNLEEFSGNINDIVSNNKTSITNVLQKMDGVADNLSVFLESADEVLGENKEDIKVLIANLKVFSSKISKRPSSLVWKSKEEKIQEVKERRQKAREAKKQAADKRRQARKRRSKRR
jgi:phospholipid/cholesterol/gamma-HCH transport system substrate-binding protein